MNEQTAPRELQLRSLSHLTREIRFFSNWRAAYDHLRDHLLTWSECEAWALVAPKYLEVLDPTDADARLRYSQSAWASCGETAQSLYDIYHAAVRDDNCDAETLGWTCEDADTQITSALGTSGVLLIASRSSVISAYLPGQGDRHATSQARDSADSAPLPRELGMRSGRPGSRKDSEHDRRARERREADWTRNERLFYHVFKRAVQFIKRSYHLQRDMRGKWIRHEYALLKDKLPPRSGLDLERWQELRDRCREVQQ